MGCFPRRDILFFPLVMLTIAGVLSYLVNSFAVFEPMLSTCVCWPACTRPAWVE